MLALYKSVGNRSLSRSSPSSHKLTTKVYKPPSMMQKRGFTASRPNMAAATPPPKKKPIEEEEEDEEEDLGPYVNPETGEVGGPKGPEPSRYGDWERKGRVSDF